MWITSSLSTVKTPTCVALGNFDGVHRGHRQVIQPILPESPEFAEDSSPAPSSEMIVTEVDVIEVDVIETRHYAEKSIPQTASPYATVVTFHPHPQEFFTGQPRLLLTPLAEKVQFLEAIGVEQLLLLTFNQALAALNPSEFVETVLVQQLQAKRISVGQDFCFGQRRSGTAADLQAIAAQYGIPVEIAPLCTCEGDRISSSAIRHALDSGDLHRANQLLGRPYSVTGTVVRGQQLGRTIGFPTANLKLPAEKYLPRQGVYAVRVDHALPGSSDLSGSSEESLRGVMNIGNRPTIDGRQQTIEVHLLDWSGDLYNQTLTVSLEYFLRPEQKFASLDELQAQIQSDSDRARSLLASSQLV